MRPDNIQSANSLVGAGRDVLGKRYFFPSDPEKTIVDSRIHDLSDFVKSIDLYDKLARAENALWDYIYLYAIQTSIWRKFPNLKLTDIVEGRASRSDAMLEKSLLWLDIHKTIASKHSRDAFPGRRFQIEISQMLEKHGKADPKLLRHRNYEISFRDPAGNRYHSASPKTARDWLRKVRKIKLSSDESLRLVQAYFLTHAFLLTHPFADGNGRFSRLAFNHLSSPSGQTNYPLSIFFLLQIGNTLYNFIYPSITLNLETNIARCFITSCESAIRFIDALSSNYSQSNRISNFEGAASRLFTRKSLSFDSEAKQWMQKLEPFIYHA